MSMIFQSYALWPHMTVGENVAYGLKLRKNDRDTINRKLKSILTTTHLEALADRYPGELSGGQQQRVALARSLVVEPDILLLDEPLSNLDAKLRERMRTELKELQRRTGITFVYVTHDQAEALALSDQVAVISGGRLQQYGTPFEVYAHPANRMVADFMGLVNLLPGRIREMKNGIASVELAPDLTVGIKRVDGLSVGERVDVAIRPENISLAPPAAEAPAKGTLAKVTNHVFLGNLSEYEVALSSGPVLRVQTHPLQRFRVGEPVAIEIDATQCSAFSRIRGERTTE
jgi:iron(III) transport system ATP-binding protein